jgi:hypothetical protein
LLGRQSRQIQAVLIEVDPGHFARGLYRFRHPECDRSDAAPDVEAMQPGTQSDSLQQRLRRGPLDRGQQTEALCSAVTAAKDIIVTISGSHCCFHRGCQLD